MANALLDRAWAVPANEIDATAKSVLVNLCDRANDEGDNLRMSVAAIARETAWDRVTVWKALKRLEAQQFIERRGTGRKGIVHYVINVAALKWERWQTDRARVAENNSCGAQQVRVA